MIKKYLSLVSITAKKNSKIYNLRLFPLFLVLLSYISYTITPLFIILRLSANFVTGINFIISIISIYCIMSLDNNLFYYGICLFILFRVLDICDGSIARHNKTSSFYGRFLDAIVDIFYEHFLILSVAFFISNFCADNSILYLGILVGSVTTFSNCMHDKYSSLARWSNLENKTKIIPYIRRRGIISRVHHLSDDVSSIALISLPLFLNKPFMLCSIFLIYLFVRFLSSAFNIVKHIISSKKNFKVLARKRNYYIKKNEQ